MSAVSALEDRSPRSPFAHLRALHRAAKTAATLPVAAGLSQLEGAAQEAAIDEPLIVDWATSAYELAQRDVTSWFARAWWGAAASRMIRLVLHAGRSEEVLTLFGEELIGWGGAVDTARTPLLAGAHIGPMVVARHALDAGGSNALMATRSRHPEADNNLIILNNERDSARFLTVAVLRLREGRPVYAGADGRWGELKRGHSFMGRPVLLARSFPRLIRVTEAKSALYVVVWNGNRLQVRQQSLPSFPAEVESDPNGAWSAVWTSAYLEALENICREDPANLRLHGGLWKPGSGGVFG